MLIRNFVFAALALVLSQNVNAEAAKSIPKDAVMLKCETEASVGQSVNLLVGNGHELVLSFTEKGKTIFSEDYASVCDKAETAAQCQILMLFNEERTISADAVSLPFMYLEQGRAYRIVINKAGGQWSGAFEDLGAPGNQSVTSPVTCSVLPPEFSL